MNEETPKIEKRLPSLNNEDNTTIDNISAKVNTISENIEKLVDASKETNETLKGIKDPVVASSVKPESKRKSDSKALIKAAPKGKSQGATNQAESAQASLNSKQTLINITSDQVAIKVTGDAIVSGGKGGGGGGGKEDKKEDSANADSDFSLFSSAGLGGLGAGAAAAGAIGLKAAGDATQRFFKRASEGTKTNENPMPEKGLAQILDEQEAERKRKLQEAADTGPPRALFEQKRAEVNQAADYKAAGETMEAAGYSTVTGRRALKPGDKEMQAADFEQAQQAQAAREAVQRGLQQRRRGGTGREEVPIPPRPDTVEPPAGAGPTPTSSAVSLSARETSKIEKEKKLRETAAELGIDPNKARGKYVADQLVAVVDENGKEYDIKGKLSAEERTKVEAVNRLRERAQGLESSSRENRELERESAAPGAVQPVIIQSNNNMSTQTAIPIKAEPRVQSSFSRYNDSRATY